MTFSSEKMSSTIFFPLAMYLAFRIVNFGKIQVSEMLALFVSSSLCKTEINQRNVSYPWPVCYWGIKI